MLFLFANKMDNLVSQKLKKKFKKYLRMNKNSDDRVYEFDESPSPEPSLLQAPSSSKQIFKKKRKGTKYEPRKEVSASTFEYQANNNVSNSAANTSSHDVHHLKEPIEKANNNAFFRNGWVTNLEENKRLITEETMTGYGSTRAQSEPKILKSINLSDDLTPKDSGKNKPVFKPIFKEKPSNRPRIIQESDRYVASFDDVLKVEHISS